MSNLKLVKSDILIYDVAVVSSKINPVTYYKTSDGLIWESWSKAYDHQQVLEADANENSNVSGK